MSADPPDARYDVVVVGAGPAGLSAALVLGRAQWRVLVLDGGPTRNGPAPHSHGFLTHDGDAPAAILAAARDELAAYPSVEVRAGRAVDASADGDGFTLRLEDGGGVGTRRVLLASGVRDVLPDVPGLAESWGRAVHQCPHCHGWELRDRPVGLLGGWRSMFERAAVLRAWSTDLTAYVTDATTDGDGPEARATLDRLQALGVTVHEGTPLRCEATASGVRVVRADGGDGSAGADDLAGLFVPAQQELASPLAMALGCIPVETPTGMGPYLRATANGETTTPGVYAAGDILGQPQSIAVAVGSGARAATAMHQALALADAEEALRGGSA